MQITLPTPTWAGFFTALKAAGDWIVSLYHTGPKWMAWAAAGVLALVYFGWFAVPKIPAADATVEKQNAEILKQIADLKSDINGVSIKVDTLKDANPVFKKKK